MYPVGDLCCVGCHRQHWGISDYTGSSGRWSVL